LAEETEVQASSETEEETSVDVTIVTAQQLSRMLPNPCVNVRNLRVMGRGGMPPGVLDSAIGGSIPAAARSNRTTSRRQSRRSIATNRRNVCMY
jgi:hypothetical protein